MSDHYTKDDKECTHCGGEVRGHLCGERVIYWCEKCGANNRKKPPSVTLTFDNGQEVEVDLSKIQ